MMVTTSRRFDDAEEKRWSRRISPRARRGKREAANRCNGGGFDVGTPLGAVTVPGPGFLSVALGFNSRRLH
jgi:hypothetical protein